VEAWRQAQQAGDVPRLGALYSPAFAGTLRDGARVLLLDRGGWLRECARRFRSPATVVLSEIRVQELEVTLTVDVTRGGLRTRTDKRLTLAREGDKLLILREESLRSSRLPPPSAGSSTGLEAPQPPAGGGEGRPPEPLHGAPGADDPARSLLAPPASVRRGAPSLRLLQLTQQPLGQGRRAVLVTLGRSDLPTEAELAVVESGPTGERVVARTHLRFPGGLGREPRQPMRRELALVPWELEPTPGEQTIGPSVRSQLGPAGGAEAEQATTRRLLFRVNQGSLDTVLDLELARSEGGWGAATAPL
jgi:hypothetical protein